MIIPAALFRIIGFIDNDQLYPDIQSGGYVLCLNDLGNYVVLKFIGNKGNLSLNDMKNYLQAKENDAISKDIPYFLTEIEFLEDFDEKWENYLIYHKQQNPNLTKKETIKLKKDFKEKLAYEIAYQKRKIGKDTIIRTVISYKDKEIFNFRGKEYPLFSARCLIFDENGQPTNKGLYYYSQTANVFPVTISVVKNKNNEILDFFQIYLSKLSTVEHYIHFIEHCKRTINKTISNNEEIYTASINYNWEKINQDIELKNLVFQINKMINNGKLIGDANVYFNLLDKFVELIQAKPKRILIAFPKLNLHLNNEWVQKAQQDNSALNNLVNSIINLNFSTENVDIKNKFKKQIQIFIKQVFQYKRDIKFHCTYRVAAIKLTEEPDSWGFMQNNLNTEQLVLSLTDTYKLINNLNKQINKGG